MHVHSNLLGNRTAMTFSSEPSHTKAYSDVKDGEANPCENLNVDSQQHSQPLSKYFKARRKYRTENLSFQTAQMFILNLVLSKPGIHLKEELLKALMLEVDVST